MLKGKVPICAAKETVRMSQMYFETLCFGCQMEDKSGCSHIIKNNAI